MMLLTRISITSPTRQLYLFTGVLGMGLGLVMQVLVLAVQNSVSADQYGVATSGVTLFRSIGGAIGVALFGAVFTHILQSGLIDRLPEGAELPRELNPVAIHHLPDALRLTIWMRSARRSMRCSCWRRGLWCWRLCCRGFARSAAASAGVRLAVLLAPDYRSLMPIARWRYAYRAYTSPSRRPGKRSATRQQAAYNLTVLLIPFRF